MWSFFSPFSFPHHGFTLLGCRDVSSSQVDQTVSILGAPCLLPNIRENSDGIQGLWNNPIPQLFISGRVSCQSHLPSCSLKLPIEVPLGRNYLAPHTLVRTHGVIGDEGDGSGSGEGVWLSCSISVGGLKKKIQTTLTVFWRRGSISHNEFSRDILRSNLDRCKILFNDA